MSDAPQTNESPVLLDVKDAVATLTLCRPEKHNAFDDTVIKALIDNLKLVGANSEIRVLVLQSQGKSFSAGGDLAWMKRMADLSYEDNIKDAQQLALLMQTLNDLPIPSIAKIQGAAFGGAVGLIACCDIALASQHAKFCLSEVKLGLAPATISPYVIAAMGARRCRQLFLTAEVFDAEQAGSWNLVHSVLSAEDLDGAVSACIQQILANGPTACRETKKLIADIQGAGKPYNADSKALFDQTAELIATLRVSDEGQEGLSAFFEKRKPSWHPDFS
jgi:methylglutaconyl-CoA hydratase